MEEIYQTYAQTVYRYLFSLTRDGDLAEELTQETFYQAIRSSDRYNGSCAVSTWLCAIAKNVLYSYYKKRKQEVSLEEIEEPQAPSAEETALSSLSQQEILKRIHAVPDPGREILHLRLLGGLSFRQIGEIMSQTETWARVNYYRAKQTLVKELKTHEEYKE